MAKKSKFEQQFPGYKIIPEKRQTLKWIATWIGMAVLVILPTYITLYGLGFNSVPTPVAAGYNDLSKMTSAQKARMLSDAGRHREAAEEFRTYFQLGGNDANLMALYAFSLSQLGLKTEAVTWARKALKTAPESKAARLIHDALEPSKR